MSWSRDFIEYNKDSNGEIIAIFGQKLPGHKAEFWELYKENVERMIAAYKADEEDCSILENALNNWPDMVQK